MTALLALQAPPLGEAGGEGRAEWTVGDCVVLRGGLAEKAGLKAGEVAAVSYGPTGSGNYKVKRVSDGKLLLWFKAADFVTAPTTPLRVAAATGSVPIVAALLAAIGDDVADDGASSIWTARTEPRRTLPCASL